MRTRGPGDTVLLAPACASFDQFTQLRASRRNFQADLVNELEARTDMAQRLKTDWILFGTVHGDGVLRRADPLQRIVDHGRAGPAYGSSWHFVMRQLAWAVAVVA